MKNVIKREQCKLACGLPNVNILSKVNKFKVLLYLKKSNLDKLGKAPIMGRITLNNSMAQFSCKLSCNPKLWNSRSGRLEGKSKEAVETNAKIEHILLSANSAVDNLIKLFEEADKLIEATKGFVLVLNANSKAIVNKQRQ